MAEISLFQVGGNELTNLKAVAAIIKLLLQIGEWDKVVVLNMYTFCRLYLEVGVRLLIQHVVSLAHSFYGSREIMACLKCI